MPFLSWIFPRMCELCRTPGEVELCMECESRLPRIPMPICLYCGSPVAGEQEDPYRCAKCIGRPRCFDFARSALANSPDALKLVYALKFHRANYLATALGRILNRLWEDTPALRDHKDWCLVPVPAAQRRLFSRGYNQAEELALALGRLRGLPVISPLMRRKSGEESQTRLSAAERWRNARRSYALQRAWADGRKSLPPHIVLVDDVYTTGSTVRSCALALKSIPSVRNVGVLTLLRAGMTND